MRWRWIAVIAASVFAGGTFLVAGSAAFLVVGFGTYELAGDEVLDKAGLALTFVWTALAALYLGRSASLGSGLPARVLLVLIASGLVGYGTFFGLAAYRASLNPRSAADRIVRGYVTQAGSLGYFRKEASFGSLENVSDLLTEKPRSSQS